jgi:ATP-dependent Clp protease ATP-binding subunit ClpA
MTSGYFPGSYGSPFDDFFARYMSGARQPRQRIDITQFLSEQARELVNAAARRAVEVGNGEIDPVIGREQEIEQTVEVLSRRRKNNPVLIGEAGVGKTAIVEGIAAQIAEGDVSETLRGRRVVEIDLTGLVAGTR